tara:strand:+ start:3052 stop:3405 length:354 start_codon:yes stop_codon:yes gene_type:complete
VQLFKLTELNRFAMKILTQDPIYFDNEKKEIVVKNNKKSMSNIVNISATNCMFRANTKIYKTKKFSSKKIDHIYNSIKSKSELIFKDTEKVILIYITYPRKNSRANTISILSKEDFN